MNTIPSKSTDSNMTLLSALLLSSERPVTEDPPYFIVVPTTESQRRESLEIILDEALALAGDIELENPSTEATSSSIGSRYSRNSIVPVSADSTEADNESSDIEETKGNANKDAAKE